MRFAALCPLAILLCALCADAQTTLRRGRAEGFYYCESANTAGSGSVWATGRLEGYIWDAKADTVTGKSTPLPQGFVGVRIDVGLFDLAAVLLELRPLTFLYGKHPQFGSIKAGAKFTWPNNKDLRFAGPGLEVAYVHSFINIFNSLGGYRLDGTGFSSAGPLVEKGSIQMKALCDLDLLPLVTFLPLKAMFNLGARIPLERDFREFSQYLIYAGIGYVGLSFDVFAEYSFEGFFNRGFAPKLFEGSLGLPRTWEVAFSENPMYIVIGGRYRYPSGMVLYASVPLLISVNQGSTMEHVGDKIKYDFADEYARGVREGFDPWFAKWKLVLQASFPFRYKQTGAEMRRNFLLLKNRKVRKKIDIDERLKLLDKTKQEPAAEKKQEDAKKEEEMDENERLDAIRKRRQEIQETK